MKILIIRFSSIGDIVLTTPVIRCLKKQTNAEIHYLTKKSYSSLLEANPFIDKIWTIEKEVAEVLSILKQEKFKYIIDLHNNLRTQRVKASLKGTSFSFNKINIQKWLMVNFKINRLPDIHIVDRYLETVKSLGVKNDKEGLDYFIPDEIEFDYNKYKIAKGEYIGFAIGAAHATKRLPENKIIEICKHIKDKVVLLGGPGDEQVGERVQKIIGENVVNLCGKTSLHQSALVIRNAKKVMTHDTGMMHIAAAFQKEIISVWGNTIPEFGMYPYLKDMNKSTVFQIENLKCRPCSKIGYKKCPKGHFKCMKNQDSLAIAAKANE